METPGRVAELHRLLLETVEGRARAEAHMELGRIALDQRRADLAIRHFREALLLEPGLDHARSALRALGEYSRTQASSVVGTGRGRGRLRELFARIRRRKEED